MKYESNEQVKEIIKKIMKDEKVSYRDLADKMNTSQQNVHSIMNKKQLKFDDVSNFCEVLGYTFDIKIIKDGKNVTKEEELVDTYINDEVLKLLAELMKIAKETDIDSVVKRHKLKKG